MLLKVGELAKRCGLTVRTLHHYDTLGLLTPSARSDAGYRLYDRSDVARLHQIQALRRFGMSLTDIGTWLARPDVPLASLITRQIDMLTHQIDEAARLRDRLTGLRTQLDSGEAPDLAEWLTTLELMTMYDKYFTKDELARLPLYQNDVARETEWPAMVAHVQALMASGDTPQSTAAQAAARRWMAMVERDTGGDARLLAKLNHMHTTESQMVTQTGITPELMRFVQEAFAQTKFAIYAKYLDEDEFRFLQANYLTYTYEWPVLIGELRDHLEKGTPPQSPDVQALVQRWMTYFRSYAGDNPATHAKIRAAHMNEPEMMAGTLVDARLIDYLKQGMASLRPQ